MRRHGNDAARGSAVNASLALARLREAFDVACWIFVDLDGGQRAALPTYQQRTAGVTPWAEFVQTQRMWDKIWVGGGLAIFKLGEREARGEIVGWPCARVRYCRIAMRGVMLATVELFCRKAWVQEIPEHCSGTKLGYRMNWV